MRAVTYNVRHAEAGLGRVAEVLRELAPDVVFLQEVDRGCARSGGVDQAAELGRALGLGYAFAAAMPWDGGEYGVAILAAEGPGLVETTPLPHASPMQPDGSGEPRVLAVARFRGLFVACTHLGLGDDERLAQGRVVRARLAGHARLILGGDLNEGPDGPVARGWEGLLVDAFAEAGGEEVASGPEDRPHGRIDGLFRTDAAPHALRAFVGVAGASDHRPVVVDFEDP